MENNQTTIKINEGLTLTQNKNGLTFGTDAYLLSAFTQTLPYSSSGKVMADLGSGTGIIPLLCAEKKRFSKIYAVEIQESFASLIEKNAEQNGFSDIISPVCCDVRELKAITLGEEVDFVCSNPPYMKDGAGKRNTYDEKYIARHEVYGEINDFCACAKRILKHGGKFLSVFRPDRLEDLMVALRENNLEPKRQVFVCAHPKAEPSMVLTEAVKGANPGMRVTRMLFLSDSAEDYINNIQSDDAKAIYDSCSFVKFFE